MTSFDILKKIGNIKQHNPLFMFNFVFNSVDFNNDNNKLLAAMCYKFGNSDDYLIAEYIENEALDVYNYLNKYMKQSVDSEFTEYNSQGITSNFYGLKTTLISILPIKYDAAGGTSVLRYNALMKYSLV